MLTLADELVVKINAYNIYASEEESRGEISLITFVGEVIDVQRPNISILKMT